MTKICLLGFGEVGQILAQDLRANGISEISAWDPKFGDTASAPSRALKATETRAGTDASNAAASADVVISAVTAGQTVEAARAVAQGLRPGVVYLDLNSTSPATKVEAAALIQATGAAYIESAVMSPISPKRIRTPMLFGGPAAHGFLASAKNLGFEGAKVYSETIGQASAVKMSRSVIVKGMEALLMESMLTARRYRVEDDVLASLSDLFANPDWKKLAGYMISRSVEHGVRRAEEMREAALTVEGVGISPLMTNACVERQEWAAQFKAVLSESGLEGLLDGILSRKDQIKKEGATP